MLTLEQIHCQDCGQWTWLLFFSCHFYFILRFFFFYFLYLEQLGLGWIGNAVTSVTT